MSWRCTERANPRTLTRRECLLAALVLASGRPCAAAQAAIVAPGADNPNADADLRAALDALLPRQPLGQRGATERLATLARFRADTLSPSAAIDLHTVRAGLGIDQRIEALGGRHSGATYFALQLERCLGESHAPNDAHRLLEAEVDRLSQRAAVLLRELGYRSGTLGERFMAAASDSRWLYSDDAAGRDRAVADMNWRLHTASARLAEQFSNVPAWCHHVSVTRLTAADEAAGRQGYRQLPTATAAGTYVVDLRDMSRRPRWSLPSVVHHELLPGHLLQLPMEAAVGAHALRLAYTSGFAEGWATYAEELAAGNAFRRDAAAQLGLMHWLLFRALRGLVDCGLHTAGWSRAQALQTLQRTQGLAAYFAPFDMDLDRIIAEPSVRAAEALAWLRLRALRAAAGPRVTPPEFHRRVLQYGRQRIDAIAQSVRAG